MKTVSLIPEVPSQKDQVCIGSVADGDTLRHWFCDAQRVADQAD